MEHVQVLVKIRQGLWDVRGAVVLRLKELPGLGLGGALQVGPAFPHLLQLLLDHRPELRLLLDQLLSLLHISDMLFGLPLQ